LGVAEVLAARAAALRSSAPPHLSGGLEPRRPPLVLLAPPSVGLWLAHWAALDRSFDPQCYVLVSCSDLLPHLAPDLRLPHSASGGNDSASGGNDSGSGGKGSGAPSSGGVAAADASAAAAAPRAVPPAAVSPVVRPTGGPGGQPGEDLRWLGAVPGDEVRRCRDCSEHYLFTAGEQVCERSWRQ
jgi:hypothetical protein